MRLLSTPGQAKNKINESSNCSMKCPKDILLLLFWLLGYGEIQFADFTARCRFPPKSLHATLSPPPPPMPPPLALFTLTITATSSNFYIIIIN